MSMAVAFTTTSTATGYTTHGHVAIGPTGELVELVEGQALVMSAELRSIDGRAFRGLTYVVVEAWTYGRQALIAGAIGLLLDENEGEGAVP